MTIWETTCLVNNCTYLDKKCPDQHLASCFILLHIHNSNSFFLSAVDCPRALQTALIRYIRAFTSLKRSPCWGRVLNFENFSAAFAFRSHNSHSSGAFSPASSSSNESGHMHFLSPRISLMLDSTTTSKMLALASIA